jgi:hypothetical protein
MSLKRHEWRTSIWKGMTVDNVNVKPTHFIRRSAKVMNIFIEGKFICNHLTVLQNGGMAEV